MVEGDKWEVYIPAEVGTWDFHVHNKVKSGDVLVLRIELVAIKGDKVLADRCNTESLKGCSDRQKMYVKKQQKATPEKRKSELARIESIQAGGMKPENKHWLSLRAMLLKKMVNRDEL